MEWSKCSSKIRCLDFYANSPSSCHKKCLTTSEEKMHADIGAERVHSVAFCDWDHWDVCIYALPVRLAEPYSDRAFAGLDRPGRGWGEGGGGWIHPASITLKVFHLWQWNLVGVWYLLSCAEMTKWDDDITKCGNRVVIPNSFSLEYLDFSRAQGNLTIDSKITKTRRKVLKWHKNVKAMNRQLKLFLEEAKKSKFWKTYLSKYGCLANI